mmetsp:Transcript_43817/g.60866  ORF Transcript_43817/g.60866 Transcript_43817/m.60866 type:complete len:279 (+) Transcript_43817:2-838(+)
MFSPLICTAASCCLCSVLFVVGVVAGMLLGICLRVVLHMVLGVCLRVVLHVVLGIGLRVVLHVVLSICLHVVLHVVLGICLCTVLHVVFRMVCCKAVVCSTDCIRARYSPPELRMVHEADGKLVHRDTAGGVHKGFFTLLLGAALRRLPTISIGLDVGSSHCKAGCQLLKDAHFPLKLIHLASFVVCSFRRCSEAEVNFHVQRTDLLHVLFVLEEIFQHGPLRALDINLEMRRHLTTPGEQLGQRCILPLVDCFVLGAKADPESIVVGLIAVVRISCA